MTGVSVKWVEVPESEYEQKTTMIVQFRPDKEPKDKAEWWELLGNWARAMEKLVRADALANPVGEKP